MREIKFRAYCEKDSEWRYGHYVNDGVTHEILTPIPCGQVCELYASQVDPKTLGQFTGLKDADGMLIYEGDIVRVSDDSDDELTIGVVKFGVRWYPAFEIYDANGDTYSDEYNTFTLDELTLKVIGNIYDNPELLKD